MKKTWHILLAVLLLTAVLTGCQQTEAQTPAVPTEIKPYQEKSSDILAKLRKMKAVTEEPDPAGVTFHSVGFAADGAYLMVIFSAPLDQSDKWQQGFVYVIDEETERVYWEVPVAPVVGPLIGRPAKEDQKGYIMLLNPGYAVKSSSTVTVILGEYKREHYKVP
jgi:hypothetical protein